MTSQELLTRCASMVEMYSPDDATPEAKTLATRWLLMVMLKAFSPETVTSLVADAMEELATTTPPSPNSEDNETSRLL